MKRRMRTAPVAPATAAPLRLRPAQSIVSASLRGKRCRSTVQTPARRPSGHPRAELRPAWPRCDAGINAGAPACGASAGGSGDVEPPGPACGASVRNRHVSDVLQGAYRAGRAPEADAPADGVFSRYGRSGGGREGGGVSGASVHVQCVGFGRPCFWIPSVAHGLPTIPRVTYTVTIGHGGGGRRLMETRRRWRRRRIAAPQPAGSARLGAPNPALGPSSCLAERYRSGRNGGASKASCRETGTWVRIPPSPPPILCKPLKING